MLSSYHPRKCVLTGFPNARQQTATVHCFEAYFFMASTRSEGDGPGETIAPGRLLM
jgi:hypothetical protein